MQILCKKQLRAAGTQVKEETSGTLWLSKNLKLHVENLNDEDTQILCE